MAGLTNVTRAQIMEVMGGDIGRNVFYISLDQRQKQLEQIPWVESASVMRFAPNRLKIQIQERTPVAFAQVGSKIQLIDSSGVLMDLATKKKYSFPVIVGMNSGEPLSTRTPRMRIYNELVGQLDSGGAHYSQDLSEVDLSDPEDVKVTTNDPDGEVLVHLGSANYLDRFKVYVAHLREWRQQFAKLESVDLRYDRQIVVNPDLRGTAKQPALSAKAAKAAIAAGVKPASLVTKIAVAHTSPTTLAPKAHKDQISIAVGKTQATTASKVPPKKDSQKLSRWHKRWTPKKQATATHQPAAGAKAQIASSSQKPSPSIKKGPQSQ
jgi:cell division protein FtsQ